MSTKLKFQCPYCRAKLSVSLQRAGERLPCLSCRCDIEVPTLNFADIQSDITPCLPPQLFPDLDTSQSSTKRLMRIAPDTALNRASSVTNHIRGSRTWFVTVFAMGVIILIGVIATIVSTLEPAISRVTDLPSKRLANKIRSLDDERREDAEFGDPEFVEKLTMINTHLITRIRTLAIASDLQFDESYLGHCDAELTTVVFDRPEATYFIDAHTIHDSSFQGYLYPDSSDMCISLPISRSKFRDGHLIVADIESTKQAFRHGGLATALLLEPDPAKQSDLKRSVSALLNSPEVDRVLDSAIRGTEIDITYDCGSVSCQIWSYSSANLRFRRLRK